MLSKRSFAPATAASLPVLRPGDSWRWVPAMKNRWAYPSKAFSHSNLIEAKFVQLKNIMCFHFDLEQTTVSCVYKDSEPQRAPNVCFKHFFERNLAKPINVFVAYGKF